MRKMKNFKMCSHKPKKIFRLDCINYYAADLDGVKHFNGDLVINISGHIVVHSVEKIAKLSKFVLQHAKANYEEITISWPDFSLPRVKAGFWKALHQHVIAKGCTSVCIHCFGGHGRTGTALAAMLIENLEVEALGALQFVREKHCFQAVETAEQVEYLKDLHHQNFPELYRTNARGMPTQDDVEVSEDDAMDFGTRMWRR